MYIPAHNRETNRAAILEFMRAYPFATLVTTRSEKITATHLPFLIDAHAEELFLIAHLAKANPQWMDFEGSRDALVIFQEPHAFISTHHYERPLSVPTWNYVAVHAYGLPRILPGLEERLQVVKRTVQQFEGTLEQWNSLLEDFRATKANSIVAFEIRVTRLEARFKLSQDRSAVEQTRITETLINSQASVENAIGAMMQARTHREQVP